MSIFDRPIESPYRLADVADPCTEMFYPSWSSRGMRAVRCTRPAKGTAVERSGKLRVCGIHAKRHDRVRMDKP